ncbi:MAG: acetyl-CoA carboxylase biotin carboxyl carrier protein subunit [Spirosomataceae bacterium]|jgi:biotin carboxyl carrier protein|nr:acetyl-CoA carboxylase biotin carboxyl carrier protein subunit [Bacteroidota bacterium]
MSEQKIVVNSEGFEFAFSEEEIDAIEILKTDEENISIVENSESYSGTIESKEGRNYRVKMGGEDFVVKIKNSLDQIIDNMGLSKPKTHKLKSIKAPMPGLVIEINLVEGQEVKENEKLLILEAMKMENVIKIPHDAIIKKVCVGKGQAVDKGQVLIELE